MRRWIVLVLLLVLPVQFSWAAAASYCQHEREATPQHVGHHEHEHQPGGNAGNTAKASADAAAPDAQDPSPGTQLPGLDSDCAYCHLGAVQAAPAVAVLLPSAISSPPLGSHAGGLPSLLFDRIERPNWHRA